MYTLDLYINQALPPLKDSDSLLKALGWMDEFKVSHLPVLDQNAKLLGVISEEDIIDNDKIDISIKEAHLHYQMLFLDHKSHLLDVFKSFAITTSSVVPIIDQNEQYQGCISYDSFIKQVGNIAFFKDTGGIISLQMNEHDYTLTQIANIVEGNGAKILGAFVHNLNDSTEIQVTVKVNRNDISDILQTFERYEYEVIATFSNSEYEQSLNDKYDNFMNYLNM